mmetsp:Transcript_25854/g.36355  ORF Transcript_25854/g.36355 Transcript_25854/m.36355 type:complete len:93 (+) Transcript_25854:1-279(+)
MLSSLRLISKWCWVNCDVTQVAVDEKRQHIYALVGYQLKRYNFNGGDEQVILSSERNSPFGSILLHEDKIYVSKSRQILKIDIESREIQCLI